MSNSARRTFVLGVLGAGAATIVSAGVAVAAPIPVHGPPATKIPDSAPVKGTDCTYGQAKKAIAAQDPAVWKKITTDNHLRGHFQQDIQLTAKQRAARDAQWRKVHPVETAALETAENAGVFGDPVKSAKERKEFGAAIDRARAACAQF
ncbi:hypothetical protein [Gordonia crocea]|uniref:Haemophore haem-binding domain-containing protein n=1 Tax=Gordonia crocea TaxID=589162 RepID=A0A7M3SV42_9ACTN|nr:hypothetical protein [Gordonia crocea]GED96516.1 hypothetical protein nbrc107697_05550 [Gordonia crocea]